MVVKPSLIRTAPRRAFFSIALAFSIAIACGEDGDDDAEGPVQGPFPLEIGPSGGTAEGLEGTALEGVRLEVPEGALTESVVVDAIPIDEDVVLADPLATFVGPKFALTPDGTR